MLSGSKEIFALKVLEKGKTEIGDYKTEVKLLTELEGKDHVIQLLAYKEDTRAVYLVLTCVYDVCV